MANSGVCRTLVLQIGRASAVATACEMAPGGVPGIAASVVANGGTIYKGLVAAVRRSEVQQAQLLRVAYYK